MENSIDLALKYGGYTSLDKVYLKHLLEGLNYQEQLRAITPPPSVINAYFAELYQKKGEQAALNYFQDLSREFELYQDQPDFQEFKPFIRLNLSGKSYGLAYQDQNQAIIFPESSQPASPTLAWEVAQIFPSQLFQLDEENLRMVENDFDQQVLEDLTPEENLLTTVSRLKAGWIKLAGFNQEDLLELLNQYGPASYFAAEGRMAVAYVKEK